MQAKALRDLLKGWDEIDGDYAGLTANELLTRLEQHPGRYQQAREAILELCPAPAGKLPGARSVGNIFRQLRGRVVGGRALTQRGKSHNSAKWIVQNAAGGSGESGGSDSGPTRPTEQASSWLGGEIAGAIDHPDQSDHPKFVAPF